MPAVQLWLNEVPQFFDSSGVPLAGGQLFFYGAGSSTKLDTYTDSSGTVPNSNPMVLDAAGRPTTAIWLIAGSLYKIGLATATEPDPPNNFIPSWPIDNVEGINDASTSVTEWIASGFTPTYVSGTSFTVPGDQTSVLTVGRAVQIIDGGGTKYGWIKTTAFGALTTVTLDQNSDALTNPVSSVAYGILQGTADSSTPILPDTFPLAGGSADRSKQWRAELDQNTTATTRVTTIPDYDHRMATDTKGADVVCAATLDLSGVTGSWCDVTGATGPVTAVTLPEGRSVWTRTTGTPTFNNGASLVLLTGANITAAAGDWQLWKGYSGGVVRMVAYSRLSGMALSAVVSGETKLTSGTVTNLATLDIVLTPYAAYRNLRFEFTSFIPQTDGTFLALRFSTDGGSSYNAGATDYAVAQRVIDSANVTADGGTNTTSIPISPNSGTVGNGAAEGISGNIRLFDLTNAAVWSRATFEAVFISNAGTPTTTLVNGAGSRRTAQDTDAIRLLFNSGNIASGTWNLYGSN